jgi:hypothetical protein
MEYTQKEEGKEYCDGRNRLSGFDESQEDG